MSRESLDEPAGPRGTTPRGATLLQDPTRNKGTAFTEAERDALGLRGLLPPGVQTIEQQVRRVLENLDRKSNDLERYILLASLQDRNETLFYRVLTDHLKDLMPIVYTPTVGAACQAYGHIFRRARGLFVSMNDRGRIADVLRNWPHRNIGIVVVTDGERILGLGDLGASGMGIPVGKLALYSACAGIPPAQCLPITIDVGTDNAALHDDPLYLGLPRARLRGEAYEELLDEFIDAARSVFPDALIQLEDFATGNAFRLLARHRARVPLFDDDIQGTGAVGLAGIYSALRITNVPFARNRFLFLGAGEAGIGIADTIVDALIAEGLSAADARSRCWFFDSSGLVVRHRQPMAEHKRPYAHDYAYTNDLLAAIRALRPTALIGVAGSARAFGRPIIEAMAEQNERPIIFAMSNPTSKSECSAEEAYTWSGGRAIFASGSPFDPVDFGGRTYVAGQGNNAWIFPGVGLGALAARATSVTPEMFFMAARALAREVTAADLELGRIYPALSRIRDVSLRIAVSVAEVAWARGIARAERPDDPEAFIRSRMYEPVYRPLV